MLEPRRAENGLTFYVSPLLEAIGVPHAFSTRAGGVSPEPFASLNLGLSIVGSARDTMDRVRENYGRLIDAMGCTGRDRCWVTQVHGATACDVRRGEPFESGPPADALVCDDPARLISVKYADCVPILLSTPDGRTVAAVHAGWRGVIAGVLNGVVRRLGTPGALVAAVGPCISEPSFEVGSEVLEAFVAAFGSDAPVRHTSGGKGHVGLREAVRLQLLRAGLPANRIDTTDLCTVRDAGEFFSHRRDRGVTGRMAALIGPCAGGEEAE